jgi:hypothetical protein
MKTEVTRQFVMKIADIKLHENPLFSTCLLRTDGLCEPVANLIISAQIIGSILYHIYIYKDGIMLCQCNTAKHTKSQLYYQLEGEILLLRNVPCTFTEQEVLC